MSDSNIQSKQAYLGQALSGLLEPGYPSREAFVDLEDILGDFMNYTITTARLANFAIEQLDLDADKKQEALLLIAEQRDAMKVMAKTLERVVKRAKGVANGGN